MKKVYWVIGEYIIASKPHKRKRSDTYKLWIPQPYKLRILQPYKLKIPQPYKLRIPQPYKLMHQITKKPTCSQG